MKKILFIVVLINCLNLFGQNFVSTDKQWNVRLLGFPNYISTEIFKIEGEEIVNSIVYKKIWGSYDNSATWDFFGLVREESDIVFYMSQYATEEYVLYDFNLEIGDTTFVTNFFCEAEIVPIEVIDIDTVEYFGITRKRWHLGENGYVDEYWIEGIGSLNGPLYTRYWYCISCPAWQLLCYHNDGNLEYIMPNETECYQNNLGIDESIIENEILIKPNPVKKGYPFYSFSGYGNRKC